MRHYVSLVASVAQPMFLRVAIPEFDGVDVTFAQITVLMIPTSRNDPRRGIRALILISCWIVAASAVGPVCRLKLGPDFHFAAIYD